MKGDTVTGKEAEGQIGWDNEKAGASYGKILNVAGAELPSTGGKGLKLLYGLGAVLLLLGSLFLASHRRTA